MSDWIDNLKDKHGDLDPVKCYNYGVESTKEPWRKIGWTQGAAFGFGMSCALWLLLTFVAWALGGAS